MPADETPAEAQADSVRPRVARPPSNRGVWIFAGLLAVSGAILFGVLSAHRTAIEAPAISAPRADEPGTIAPPPELAIPSPSYDYADGQPGYLQQPGSMPQQPMPPLAVQVVRQPRPAAAPAPAYAPNQAPPAAPYTGPIAAQVAAAPAPVAPGYAFQAPAAKGPTDTASGAATNDARAHASKLLNPATTVPQGTVIQAVLETALDSNRAGFARAVVSRDVSSFDGSRVLIPKGSKLFGEYKSDVARGQNRALIQWHRLTRPDGAIIDVDSPTADPLGRVGVKGAVNSHFLERFSGAILQSALDIGVQLATQKAAGNTVIVGLPNSTTTLSPVKPDDIKPTLKVRQGTSVSVFVGRDLDFTAVED